MSEAEARAIELLSARVESLRSHLENAQNKHDAEHAEFRAMIQRLHTSQVEHLGRIKGLGSDVRENRSAIFGSAGASGLGDRMTRVEGTSRILSKIAWIVLTAAIGQLAAAGLFVLKALPQ